jgi:L-threonine kinase
MLARSPSLASRLGKVEGRRVAQAALPVTCGELVQGALDGIPCLISCPIDRCHVARVSIVGASAARGQCIRLLTPGRDKTRAVIAAAMQAWQLEGCVQASVKGDTPVGRGYGASTADMGAALYALAQATQMTPDPLELSRLAVQIEPTDSTLLPGLALFNHVTGDGFELLGDAPPLDVVVIDPGGRVDTIAFNRADHRDQLRQLAPLHREAFELMREGLRRSDWAAVGQAATMSAVAHQAILYNPLLEWCRQWAREVHVLGVCRAHSGTLLGLLFDPAQRDADELWKYIVRRAPKNVSISLHALRGGGITHEHMRFG